MITKKWKWASTAPPERWMIVAEEVSSPSATIVLRR